MLGNDFTVLLNYLEPVLCCLVLFAMWRAKAIRSFLPLAVLLIARLLGDVLCLGVIRASTQIIERHTAYHLYFYLYWCSFALDAALSLYVIYGIFRLAMEPLKGLQTLGTPTCISRSCVLS